MNENQSQSSSATVHCSFCRKPYPRVGPVVEGPESIYICYDCILLNKTIIEEEARLRGYTLRDQGDTAD